MFILYQTLAFMSPFAQVLSFISSFRIISPLINISPFLTRLPSSTSVIPFLASILVIMPSFLATIWHLSFSSSLSFIILSSIFTMYFMPVRVIDIKSINSLFSCMISSLILFSSLLLL